MKNKTILLAMIMSIMVATLFLTSVDVKKVKLEDVSAGIKTWLDATKYLRNLSIGDRKGWRQSQRCGAGKRM